MKKNVPTLKENNNGKNLVATLVIIVWLCSLIARYYDGTSLPLSVEVGFLVILGYIFGSKSFEVLRDLWRKK